MNSEHKLIKILLNKGTKIAFLSLTTGEKGSLVCTSNQIVLTKGKLYYIPINEKINLDEYYIFKPIKSINDFIDFRDIRNGFVSIIPIIPNFILKNNQEVGIMI